jgi:glycosyltransferase involved in cell wall biosynthesis
MANSKSTNEQIVVLPSWYPNKLDPFAGDFIQRHVKAISTLRPQYVIYVVKDEFAKITNDISIQVSDSGNLTEKIVYYHSKKTGLRLIDKLVSQWKYNRLYQQCLTDYISVHGLPQLVHVHVTLKAGMIALWAKRKWNIPFMLSEHWSVFLEEANYRIENFSIPRRWAVKHILKNTTALTVVSNRLGESIIKKFKTPGYQVIPNVVDQSVFFPGPINHNEVMQFIHASNMVYEKNVESILKAFSILKKNQVKCMLNLYGPAPGSLKELSKELGLEETVFFRGEVDQDTLSVRMQQSDALILYSRFETFGCVIIEANASGIPVIVSDIPVFHELVTENLNGFFVKGENAGLLADRLVQFISQKKKTDKIQVTNTAVKYSYHNVAEQFEALYKKVISA